ncbi:general substrate transporter [Mycena galopus ATCC 62051]|nr:general substrate transporter [Mycena galopus ATCC 62051]
MTLKTELEDISRYRNAYFLALSVAFGSLFHGYDVGLIGGVLSLDSFEHYFGLDQMNPREQASVKGDIVAILQLGGLFGALGVGSFSSQHGRKSCLLASGAIYIIGSALQVLVGLGRTRGYALSLLYAGRFVGGIGVGMVTALVPAYISECTPQAIRGRCTGLIALAASFGLMLSFWVNYFASKNIPSGESQWRVPFAVQIVPGVLFLLAMPFLPESPRYMVQREQYGRAARTLASLSGTTVDDLVIVETVEEIKADFVGNRHLSTVAQFRRMGESQGIALRCFIPSLAMFFQQWTGTNAINYFSPAIFASLGIDGTTADLLATGVYGGVKVLSVGLTLVIAVESIGRKKCLIIGGLGQGAMMLWIGGYSALHPAPTTASPSSYISIIAVYLYAVFFSIGWGPIPWIIAAEVAPNHLRTAVMSSAIGVSWLFSLMISKLTPIMLNDLGYGTFLLFGFCCLVMAFWAWLCLPETAGFGLEEIGLLFESDVILRALQDAPGGRTFIGNRRAAPVVKLGFVVEDSETTALLGQDVDPDYSRI